MWLYRNDLEFFTAVRIMEVVACCELSVNRNVHLLNLQISEISGAQKVCMSRGGVWVQLLRGQGIRALLVLRECIWNAAAVSLVLNF